MFLFVSVYFERRCQVCVCVSRVLRIVVVLRHSGLIVVWVVISLLLFVLISLLFHFT